MKWMIALALVLSPLVALAALDQQQAIERAIHAANAALDAAYKKDARRKDRDPIHPAHEGPWVTAEAATATAQGSGWRVRWFQARPTGYEFECVVSVSSKGATHVDKVWARYASD